MNTDSEILAEIDKMEKGLTFVSEQLAMQLQYVPLQRELMRLITRLFEDNLRIMKMIVGEDA